MKFKAHPWHGIKPGENCPEEIRCFIEVVPGDQMKYEIDKESGLIKLDRALFSAVHYPANYGFIPKTYADDKDPLDILVITSLELPHLCLVEAKVIGVMRMVDQGEMDDKIIAVALHDESVNYINDISELPPHTTIEMRRFFEDYKLLENTIVHFSGEIRRVLLLKLHDLYTNDGELSTLNKFYDKYEDPIFNEIKSIDYELAREGNYLYFYRPYESTDFEKYDNYIRKAAPREKAYVALQKMIAKELNQKNWQEALKIVNNYKNYATKTPKN
jgi:inorganic pyrophosphatase